MIPVEVQEHIKAWWVDADSRVEALVARGFPRAKLRCVRDEKGCFHIVYRELGGKDRKVSDSFPGIGLRMGEDVK